MNKKKESQGDIILSGMRPTGKLHIGHLSVLENWARLQEEYRCYYFVANWHALTTDYMDTSHIPENTQMMLLDWLAAGLDPEKSSIFLQSHIKEHAELTLLLGMNIPLSWLERVPTYKDQILQLAKQGKDINTYGFLGYPLLMAADIIVYRANWVPVGEDQGPHLEFSRELVRRFNYLYDREVFPEPQPKFARIATLPGIDGRKMSKSYHNDIAISATPEEVMAQVKNMVTDPARIKKSDLGHPEICIVYKYQEIYNEAEAPEIKEACAGGKIGCVECKKRLAGCINAKLEPIREKRVYYEQRPELLKEIVAQGDQEAKARAEETMKLVREAMHLS
ncbi:MAG: tryptophan--tRNA ligase [Peptococcaceae bacterium]|nr:tryptophan--tRNA ligase [Peptococcaceae bacterium]